MINDQPRVINLSANNIALMSAVIARSLQQNNHKTKEMYAALDEIGTAINADISIFDEKGKRKIAFMFDGGVIEVEAGDVPEKVIPAGPDTDPDPDPGTPGSTTEPLYAYG